MNIRTYVMPAVLLVIGSLQLIGYCADLPAVRKSGHLTAASPLPLVFSHFRGLETFSPRFAVVASDHGGNRREIAITPELYEKLDGPYNRRNIYGVVFAFGAVLSEQYEHAMVHSVLSYGLCPGGPVRQLFEDEQLIHRTDRVSIVIRPKYGLTEKQIDVQCTTL